VEVVGSASNHGGVVVRRITGIPHRQIHYWESKGYIETASRENSIRRYTYPMIKKMILIKELIDEGYTLEAAVRKVNDRNRKIDEAVSHLKNEARRPRPSGSRR